MDESRGRMADGRGQMNDVDRRDFVKAAAVASAALATGVPASLGEAQGTAPRKFKLAYAPHFGMFRQHAPGGLAAELEFMAAEGFTALEDNGLKGRSGRRPGADRQHARAPQHAHGRVRGAHDLVERAAPRQRRRRDPRRVPQGSSRIDRRREASQREVDDRRAGPRRPAARHELPDRERDRGAQARRRRSSSRTGS